MTRIDFWYANDCPNAPSVRRVLDECLRRRDLAATTVHEHQGGDYPSPTILVDGVDILGESPVTGAACRLFLPSRDRTLDALASSQE